MIKKTAQGKFQVTSKAGNILGTHKSRDQALRQLAAIEASKKKAAEGTSGTSGTKR